MKGCHVRNRSGCRVRGLYTFLQDTLRSGALDGPGIYDRVKVTALLDSIPVDGWRGPRPCGRAADVDGEPLRVVRSAEGAGAVGADGARSNRCRMAVTRHPVEQVRLEHVPHLELEHARRIDVRQRRQRVGRGAGGDQLSERRIRRSGVTVDRLRAPSRFPWLNRLNPSTRSSRLWRPWTGRAPRRTAPRPASRSRGTPTSRSPLH